MTYDVILLLLGLIVMIVCFIYERNDGKEK